MKNIRKLLAAGLAVVMVAGLAGCGGGGSSAEDIMKTAQEKLKDVKSMNCEMVMNMDMSSNGQTMSMSTTGDIAMDSEPLLMKMDMDIKMDAAGQSGNQKMVMYAEQADQNYTMYMSPDGTNWVKQTMTDMANMEQYDAQASMDMYLSSSESFKEAGTEKINGSDATKYEGIISQDAMNEVMSASGAADSLAQFGISEEDAAALYQDLGELPIAIWIDNESSLPVKYEMDMTAVMQKLMDNMVKTMGEAASGMEFSVDKMFISMTMSDFNSIEAIEIPEAAKNAQEAQIM